MMTSSSSSSSEIRPLPYSSALPLLLQKAVSTRHFYCSMPSPSPSSSLRSLSGISNSSPGGCLCEGPDPCRRFSSSRSSMTAPKHPHPTQISTRRKLLLHPGTDEDTHAEAVFYCVLSVVLSRSLGDLTFYSSISLSVCGTLFLWLGFSSLSQPRACTCLSLSAIFPSSLSLRPNGQRNLSAREKKKNNQRQGSRTGAVGERKTRGLPPPLLPTSRQREEEEEEVVVRRKKKKIWTRRRRRRRRRR